MSEAAAATERFLQLSPDDDDAWQAYIDMGAMLHENGQVHAALPIYQTYLKRFPDRSADAWTHLGTLLASESRTEEARNAFQKAVALDPQNPEAERALEGLR